MKLRRPDALALPAGALLALAFLVPVGLIFAYAFLDPVPTLSHMARVFGPGPYVTVFLNTAQVAAIVAALCLLLGYPYAAFVAFQPPRRRTLLLFLVLVPLWMSILVRTYAWMVVLGREGIVNTLLIGLGLTDGPVKLLFTTSAVIVAMVQILLPFTIVTCYAAMTQIDLTLVRAARIMGASPAQAFARIFLPLSAEGAVNGFIIVFILSMGFFITPALLGGRQDAMVANIIATQVGQANWAFAAALAIVLLVATLALLAAFRLAVRPLLGRTS